MYNFLNNFNFCSQGFSVNPLSEILFFVKKIFCFKSIYIVYTLLVWVERVCLSVCLFVSYKRQNGYTDLVQILYRNSRDPRECLWMFEFSKIYVCFCFKLYTKRTCSQLKKKMGAAWKPSISIKGNI